jgi:hypothetical protein
VISGGTGSIWAWWEGSTQYANICAAAACGSWPPPDSPDEGFGKGPGYVLAVNLFGSGGADSDATCVVSHVGVFAGVRRARRRPRR